MHVLDTERLDDAAFRVTDDVKDVSVGELALTLPVHVSDVLEDVGRAVSRCNDAVSGITESSFRLRLRTQSGVCERGTGLLVLRKSLRMLLVVVTGLDFLGNDSLLGTEPGKLRLLA